MTKEDTYWKEREFVIELVDQIPAAIFWKNASSVFLGCNKFFADLAALSSPKEIIGKTDYDLPWGKYQAEIYRNDDQQVMQTRKPKLDIEESQTLTNGKEIVLLTSKIPLFSKSNELVGILGIYHDITARKEIEISLDTARKQAEAANHAKTEFIANMSHDIRTPLAGIVGMSKLLEDKLINSEEKQYALWINESGEQLLGLLNGVLDVVAADNIRESDLKEEPFDIRSTIQEVIQLEIPSVKMKNLELHIEIDKDIPSILLSDRTKLHRILLNLLGNAIKFTDKGRITIQVKLLSKNNKKVRLKFRIMDTGKGISSEIHAKVFERFFRGSPSYKEVYSGHGVGLHIAQKYVELLGGTIKLTSQLGKGSSFSFILSLKIDKDTVLNNHHSMVNNHPIVVTQSLPVYLNNQIEARELPNLLLVEDNVIALRLIEILAKKAGCQFTSVNSGELALDLIKTNDFDLLITDIGLPGMSGKELVGAIRQWEKESEKYRLPIIGLTAHVLDKSASDCLQCGMDKVMTKPMHFDALKDILIQFITPRQKLKAMSPTYNHLGPDLPLTEQQLFELSHLPILDFEIGLQTIGNEGVLNDLLHLLLSEAIPEDLVLMKEAYRGNDWQQIEDLAHKMKSGALYCGALKMQYACQYLERYRKAGHTRMLHKLYQQLIEVLNETIDFLTVWLKKT